MNRIMVDPSMGSAETEYGSSQTVDKAFDEYTDGDGQYYCSLTGHPTGLLQRLLRPMPTRWSHTYARLLHQS